MRKHGSGVSKASGHIFGVLFACGDPHAVPDHLRHTYWLFKKTHITIFRHDSHMRFTNMLAKIVTMCCAYDAIGVYS